VTHATAKRALCFFFFKDSDGIVGRGSRPYLSGPHMLKIFPKKGREE
jgi:hypothetical protein